MEKRRTRSSDSPEGQLKKQAIQGELTFEFEVHHFFLKGPDNKYFRLSEPTHKFSKVARYKINTQKSVVLLYTNNELSEREIKKTMPLTIASRRIKYLGMNLSKDKKWLYIENNKMLMKETEEDTN